MRPSSVAGLVGPVWLRMPSRTGAVRFRPTPSRSSTSTTRSECSLCLKPPPSARGAAVERLLARVAEGRVAEIMSEPDRLRQILVQPQRPGDGAGDPARLQRVAQPRPVMVALGRDEDLGLVLQPPERLRVHDPIAVALERRAQRAVGLGDGTLRRV